MEGSVQFWARNDRPSVAADLARTWLGISHEQQVRSRDSGEFFNLVISALDHREIQVLRLQFPVEEARAFCLGDSPKVIVVTTNDNVVGSRIFSTFHELGHLSLGESSICLPLEEHSTNDDERYCDLFATELLMPTQLISKLVGGLRGVALADAVDELADVVKSSKTALLIKFKQMELIDEDELQIKLAELKARNPRKQQGRSTRTSIVVKEKGMSLPRLVFTGLKNSAISPIEASRYLNLNQSHLTEVGSRLGYL
jgi:Zn-dependent peptidase ImmA (M78 family)